MYYTKFECILKATLMPTNRTRGARGDLKLPRTPRLRGDANQCASDTLADSRVQKPKNFLAFSSRLLPPPLHREAEKEMERKFLVLLRRFSLRKEQSYFNIFVCSFLHPHGDRGALLFAFGGSSNLREPHTTAYSQPARIRSRWLLRRCVCSLGGFDDWSW